MTGPASGSGSGSGSVDGGQTPLPAIKTPRMAVSLALKLTEIIILNGTRKVAGLAALVSRY